MKTKTWRLSLAAILLSLGTCLAADDSIANLVSTKLKPADFEPHLEASNAGADANTRSLKAFKVADSEFSGRVKYYQGDVEEVLIWQNDDTTSPTAAAALFETISKSLSKLGKDRLVKDAPSVSGAPDTKTEVRIWKQGDDLVVLIHESSDTTGSVSLTRATPDYWLTTMSPTAKEFWETTLGTENGKTASDSEKP